jgi:hypothetical protein
MKMKMKMTTQFHSDSGGLLMQLQSRPFPELQAHTNMDSVQASCHSVICPQCNVIHNLMRNIEVYINEMYQDTYYREHYYLRPWSSQAYQMDDYSHHLQQQSYGREQITHQSKVTHDLMLQ